MSLINVSNLTFAYDGSYDNVFENVSFQLDTAWKLGFTGRNGRGKTTFLNLLMKKYQYKGSISASVDFEYFPYPVADSTQLTLYVIENICPDYEQWRLLKDFNRLKINEDVLYREFNTLSKGEQTKVLLAALFQRENSFLLIDEPTNHLDMEGRGLVASYLNSKSGYILVSHDASFLDHCIDHILVINKTNIEVQKGNFSSWQANKKAQDNFELSENAKLKKEIKHLEAAAKRTADWSDKAEAGKIGFDPTKVEKSISRRAYEGAKAKKLMASAMSIRNRQDAAIDEKKQLLKNIETADSLKITPLEFYTDRLVTFHKVALSYGEKTVCSDVSLDIMTGDRVALCGHNGCGKSSVLKLICGENISFTGDVSVASRLKISYVPQSTDGLCGGLIEYARIYGIDENLFRAILIKLDFKPTQFDKDISEYSAGQKKKVLIARSLCEQATLYIWDEPLNYIDVFSRMQIEELILKCSPTLLFVEHDASFCDKIATKRIEL